MHYVAGSAYFLLVLVPIIVARRLLAFEIVVEKVRGRARTSLKLRLKLTENS